jgi:hypothetical protein
MHGMFITYLQALRHCTLLRYDILPFCLGSKRLILEFVTAGMIFCHLECAFREALHYIFTLTNGRLKPMYIYVLSCVSILKKNASLK